LFIKVIIVRQNNAHGFGLGACSWCLCSCEAGQPSYWNHCWTSPFLFGKQKPETVCNL